MKLSKKIYFENKKNFQRIISKTKNEYSKGNYIDSVYYAKFGANYAWFHHPGLFYSNDLENILISIAMKNLNNNIHKNNTFLIDDRLKIMHVASEILDVGGHTRAIFNWVENSKAQFNNLLVLTRNVIITPFLESLLKRYNITPMILNDGNSNVFNIASKLRQIAKEWPDYIILHTHPDDAIPILAFASFEGPPILLFNHADHVFWLGSKISDATLNIRKEGLDLSAQRRGITNNFLLPLPLQERSKIKYNKDNQYFLKNKKIILTMASDYKYTPFGNYNFSYFFENFLEKRKDVGLIVIGAIKTGNFSKLYKKFSDRVLLVSPTPNIEQYLSITDVYIDSFPMSSLTSYLEAGIRGIPVIGVKNNTIPFLSARDPAFDEISFPTFLNSLNDLRNELEFLLDDSKEQEERGTKIRESIVAKHCNDEWLNLANKRLRLVKDHKMNKQNEVFIDKESNYDEYLANFFHKINENNRLMIKFYEWITQFSYLYLNDFIGKNIEHIGKYISSFKNDK